MANATNVPWGCSKGLTRRCCKGSKYVFACASVRHLERPHGTHP